MIFIIVAFDYHDTQYIRLGEVLVKSIKLNCPGADILFHVCDAPVVEESERALLRFGENAEKLRIWVRLLEGSTDDEIILIDSDMMVLKDVSEIFDLDFDVGYTRRTKEMRIKYNGGVMFVKKNERSLQFFRDFRDIDDKMYEDREFHQVWRDKYAGMNQAAFGYMMENYDKDIKLLEIPCAIYNSCSDDWKNFNDETKIVHLKGPLRNIVLSDKEPSHYKNIRDKWKKIEDLKIR